MKTGLFGWLLQASARATGEPEVQALFTFLRSLINREDLIEDIWKRYERVGDLPATSRESEYVNLYFALEQFITSQKPLIVKEELTKDKLRQKVQNQLNVRALPAAIGLLFFSSNERAVAFFLIASREIVGKAITVLGLPHVTEIVGSVIQNAQHIHLRVDADGLHSDGVDEQVAAEELHAALTGVYRVLFEDLASTLGRPVADELVKNTYTFVQSTYGAEFLDEFFSYLPENVLDTEHLAYLSKEDLARKVDSATKQEKRKKEEAEMLARQLAQKVNEMERQYVMIEDTKKAMLNLLEDSRALETTLKEERDRATAIVASMGEGLFVVDREYRITLANKAAQKLIGMNQEEALGKHLPDMTVLLRAGKELPVEERPLFRTIKSGESLTTTLEDDIWLRTKSGTIPIALSTAPLKRDNEIVGGLVTFYDVTKDREVKMTIERTVEERTRELKQEHARMTASIKSLVAGFIMTDPAGTILTKNPASTKILGIDPSIGCLEDVEKALEGNIKLHELHEQSHKDGKPVSVKNIELRGKFIELFVAPIFVDDAHKEFIGTVILVQDVTEEKILQRSRDEFFSIASHELRTPLTAIRGNTSMLQEFYADKMDGEMKDMIKDVHESSVQLIDIVNDFLNMSRLEQKKINFSKDVFDLPELIRTVLKEYQVTGSRQKLALTYKEPTSPVPLVEADKTRVKEILINLVGNSIKFTEEGGVTVSLYLHDGKVRVIVEDTGKGIPFENQVLLFRKFQQAGDNLFTRDTKKGTGLGLYISKLLVEGMGGTIGLVHSQPGKGSAFGFSLPVAPGQQVPAADPADTAPWPPSQPAAVAKPDTAVV